MGLVLLVDDDGNDDDTPVAENITASTLQSREYIGVKEVHKASSSR
jgi:hypothetical protein